MGFLPHQVRACDFKDFIAAYYGWLRSKGVDPDGSDNDGYPTEERIRELSIKYG